MIIGLHLGASVQWYGLPYLQQSNHDNPNSMKTIKLTRGYEAIVDDEDFERVSALNWCVLGNKRSKSVYAYKKVWQKDSKSEISLRMHNFILGDIEKGKEVDHINGNTLDNRKSNLRAVSHMENLWNAKLRKDNKHGKRGIYSVAGASGKTKKRWYSQIAHKGKVYYLGIYTTKEEAGRAYENKAKELRGDFLRI